MILGEEVMLQYLQRCIFQRTLADRQPVATGATLLVPGTAIIVLAADRVIGSAAVALDEAGQEMLLAVLVRW